MNLSLRTWAEIFVVITLVGAVVFWRHENMQLNDSLEKMNSVNSSLLSDVQTMKGAASAQEKAIDDLQAQRATDNATTAKLTADNAKLRRSDAAQRRQISDLEANHEDVHTYLDRAVPPALACVLNSTCPASSPADSASDAR